MKLNKRQLDALLSVRRMTGSYPSSWTKKSVKDLLEFGLVELVGDGKFVKITEAGKQCALDHAPKSSLYKHR